MLMAAQRSPADQRLSDGRILRLGSRSVRKRVAPEELHSAVTQALPPQFRTRSSEVENVDGMEVAEQTDNDARSDLDRFCDWLEDTVMEVVAPPQPTFKILKRARTQEVVDGAEADTLVRRMETYKQSIDSITAAQKEDVKSLKSEVADLEAPVMQGLERLGGACRYRVVHEGEEIYASLFMAERQLKGRIPTAKEMRMIVQDAARRELPEDASFSKLVKLWKDKQKCVSVADAISKEVRAIEEQSRRTKRAVVLRRGAVD